MAAQLVENKYASGKVFYTVECHDCMVVLNSGHHYRPDETRLATAIANEHNKEVSHPNS